MITVRHSQSERASKAFQESREALIRFWCNADKGIYLSLKTAGAITGIVGFLLNSSEGQLFWVRGAWQGCDRRVSLILPRLGL
jgi:hypothetical protein